MTGGDGRERAMDRFRIRQLIPAEAAQGAVGLFEDQFLGLDDAVGMLAQNGGGVADACRRLAQLLIAAKPSRDDEEEQWQHHARHRDGDERGLCPLRPLANPRNHYPPRSNSAYEDSVTLTASPTNTPMSVAPRLTRGTGVGRCASGPR